MSNRTCLLAVVALATVLVGTAAVYWPGLDGPFLLDDYQNIVFAYVGDFDTDRILYAVTHNESGILGRPVSMLSILFSGIVHGPGPWGYKFHNLLIHLINGLLIFWLLIRLLPRMSSSSRENQLLVAGLVATCWLLHPLMVSTVLYAVQRMAQLSALFTLAALLVYVFLRENARDHGGLFYLQAFLVFPACLLLSIFSKENGVLVPVYILAIELVVYRFGATSTQERNRVFSFLGVFVVVPLLVGALYYLTHIGRFSDFSLRDFTLAERLMTELRVMVMYLKMILLPRLADMTLFHDYIQVVHRFDLVTAILLLLLAGAVFLVFYLREKAPVAAFAIAWFLVSHLLESTVLSLELMFEHRNYLAAVGPLLGVIYYLCNVPEFPQLKYLSGAFLLLVVFLTMGRVTEWQSREVLYQLAITEHPDSLRAHTEMAGLDFTNGNTRGAIINLEAAKEIDPAEFGIPIQESVFLCGTGNDLSQLVQEAREKAARFPMTVYSLNSLDNMVKVINDGICPELNYDYALAVIQAALAQEDNQKNAEMTGFLENIEGGIYLAMHNYPGGIRKIFSAYEKTGSVRILGNLADNLLQLNLIGDAEVIIREIDTINTQSHGVETAMLVALQEKLRSAKVRVAQSGDGGNRSGNEGE